ncbi:hypothetical protein C922_00711 [Plasmodium inui San Antonio 1]|uniref:Uncharacterized protein n=1 Tax=Plasmodium inui San Antonio 1 TaxID=1237626 RepID=W7ABH9_9APIC|nr:hypothetical protein C922_00711 [Plasmodium inui San Antonio 1]EUD69020.1 hypothetical protein C922_00711 [Plasmodium inui San Antonio 1]
MMSLLWKKCTNFVIARYKKRELRIKCCYNFRREFSSVKASDGRNGRRDINTNNWGEKVHPHVNTKTKGRSTFPPSVDPGVALGAAPDAATSEEDHRDLYFNNKVIQKRVADIIIKNSHNESLFGFLPMEGRTNKVPKGFKICQCLSLLALSSGVLLIHILPEMGRENYIRDIFSFEIYCCSCILVFHGGLNSLLQLIQYGVPPTRKYKGLYNSLRLIYSIIPLFFGLITSSLCDSFPKDSILLLMLSYMSLLLNYYLLHNKCLIPAWMFRQCKFLTFFVLFNLLLLLISEAQIYRGRKVSIQVDD